MGPAEAREHAQAVLGDTADGLELEFKDAVVGNRSPADSPLATAIEEWLAQADPEATLVPIVMAGFSDSHWFRRRSRSSPWPAAACRRRGCRSRTLGCSWSRLPPPG
jgi:hypothetical protein